MRIFIDASVEVAALRVFGMGLVERLIRGVLSAGIEPSEILVVRHPDAPPLSLPCSDSEPGSEPDSFLLQPPAT